MAGEERWQWMPPPTRSPHPASQLREAELPAIVQLVRAADEFAPM
jgi:hypothetical protein